MGRVYVPVFGSSGDFVPTAGGGAGFSAPIFAHASNALSGPSISVTLNSILPGSLVVVFAGCRNDNPSDVVSVVDDLAVSATNDYAVLAGGLDYRHTYWSFINHGGGNRTFTANFVFDGPNRLIHVIAVSGGATASFHGSATNNGSSAAPSSGNLSPAPNVDGEFILGFAHCSSGITAVAAPFTVLFDDDPLGVSGYYIQPTAGAIAAGWTSPNDLWEASAVSYKP